MSTQSRLSEKIEENDNILASRASSESTSASSASHASPVTNQEFPPKCYRCDFIPANKKGYDAHCGNKHPNLSGYPNNASIEAYGLKPQGMSWEI